MSYIFKIDEGDLWYKNTELDENIFSNIKIFSKEFNISEVEEIIQWYQDSKLSEKLDSINKSSFVLFLCDKDKNTFFAINDKFSTNEIFFCQNNESFFIFNDVKKYFSEVGEQPVINYQSFYELFTFYSINPPETIYQKIKTVPASHVLICNAQDWKLDNYWNLRRCFSPKQNNYDKLIADIRNSLEKSCIELSTNNNVISLSGGVDSGGLLGMLKKNNKPVKAISIGPYGLESPDLPSARMSASFNQVEHFEVYPEYEDLIKLRKFNQGLNQPVDGHHLFPSCLILEKAQSLGAKNIFYGFGAEMLLGNLKICRLAYYLYKIENIVPLFILKPFYLLISKYKKFSKNQTDFLLEKSWAKRFLRARGPLFDYYKKYFKKLSVENFPPYKNRLDKILKEKKVDIIDRIVISYLGSWVNDMQLKQAGAMGRQYAIIPAIPFDTSIVACEMFKTRNKFRKLNSWNKQVIRDVFKPFISEELYKNKVRSLIIPYSEWFRGRENKIFKYLKTNKIIPKIFDLDFFARDYDKLPEPGLNLMRLLSFAVWYDANWDKSNMENFDNIF